MLFRSDLAFGSGATYVFRFTDGPCLRDDIFLVPAGSPMVIPVGALLANDAHPQAAAIRHSGQDAATARGVPIVPMGSPPTALSLPPFPPGIAEDTFNYRVTDGTHEGVGEVHLRLVSWPTPPVNAEDILPPIDGSGLTFLFNAPGAGTYLLERLPMGEVEVTGAVWTSVATQSPAGPGVIAFTDGSPPYDAIYRIRRVH